MNTAPVILGAVLVSVGAMLGMAGLLIGGREIFVASRRWLRDLDVPPSEVARHRWDQTKAAATAGARAWQHHNGAPTRHGYS